MTPRNYARLAGILYLYIIIAGTFAEVFVRSRLIVPGDAAATAKNIADHETLFRVGFSAEFLHLACDVAVTAILYMLLKPASALWAFVAALFRLACIIILAAAGVTQFAALRLLSGAGSLDAFQQSQLHAAAFVVMELHGDGYNISLMFFGFSCVVFGFLIARSAILPRVVGWLMAVAGACYLINSFVNFLRPSFAPALFPALFVPILVAELALSVWLIAAGIREAPGVADWSRK